MRYLLLSLCLLLPFLSFSQTQNENELAEYSFAEFFKMIEDEEDSVFRLENALIFYDELTDNSFFARRDSISTGRDTLHIRKAIALENVVFDPTNRFSSYNRFIDQIKFHRSTSLMNVFGSFQNIYFEKLNITFSEYVPIFLDIINSNPNIQNFSRYERLVFNRSVFEIDPVLISLEVGKQNIQLQITNSEFRGGSVDGDRFFLLRNFGRFRFTNNVFKGNTPYGMAILDNADVIIENNDFGVRPIDLVFATPNEMVRMINNKFSLTTALSLNENTANFTINWSQFKNGLISSEGYSRYLGKVAEDQGLMSYSQIYKDQTYFSLYEDSVRFADNESYREEVKLLGTINDIYKRQHDLESANASYIRLKDLQTQRLEYIYQQNASFDTFFEWKVNQFLKVFSDYGTRPSKAITMSVYVIIVFALVYLFFPNYWDSHGKHRIMDRYRFFLKYVNKDSGIHEVYLDEKKPELLAAEDFKLYLEEQGKTAPKFFMATALPLYRWSVAGTKSFSWLLSKVDVLKGTWMNTDPSKQRGKSILIIGAFLIALLYDIFIKMLNALMLSINTFTTLGFGEIPIKGLPRYLAIIQGFIGWFMLTIFSVSLISQLLN